MAYDDGLRAYEVKKPFEGVIPNLERRYKETESDWARDEILPLHVRDALRGLRRQAPQAGGAGSVEDRRARHRRRGAPLGARRRRLVRGAARRAQTPSRAKIRGRISQGDSRSAVPSSTTSGLDISPFSRASGTCRGGESQRISARLADRLGVSSGVLYVARPSPRSGLHSSARQRSGLPRPTLKAPARLGTRLIVVRDDEDAIRQADYVVRRRPGRRALPRWLQIIAKGSPPRLIGDLRPRSTGSTSPARLNGGHARSCRRKPQKSRMLKSGSAARGGNHL